MSFEVGQRIADYEIEGLLGIGGMGRVYRVRNVISDRTEAVKVLLTDLSAEPDLAARFLGEIRTLAGLDHPHIAQLRTALQTGNELVMVMEFVDGCTLQQMAQQGPLPVGVVVGYMYQVLAALSYAHSRGVVHRDIKPANIMVTPQGVIKLTDFGIAKSKSKDELTRPGTTVGSLNYMSPEQALGGCTADGRSDIYSIGITLYELLVGRRPFEDESAYVILHSQLNVVPVAPIEVNPLLSRSLSDLVMKALEKEPEKRFQTAAALSEALRHATGIPAANSLEIVHAVPDAVNDALSWFSTGDHRRLWLTAEVIAGLVIAGSAAWSVPRVLKHEAAPARVAFSNAPAQVRPAPQTAIAALAPPSPQPSMPTAAARPVVLPTSHVQPVTIAAQKTHKPDPGAAVLPQAKFSSVDTGAAAPSELELKPAVKSVTATELEEIRKQRAVLDARASVVSASVRRLRTAEAADGDVLNGDVAGAFVDMNMNLSEGKAALEDGDVVAARGHMEKAAIQVSLLEKLLSDKTD